ncbi:MAG: hypothetical protein SF097_06040 [Acidobacteriota bacterium]|nr:hypothetical protein [Acidobacteriota bacterium]
MKSILALLILTAISGLLVFKEWKGISPLHSKREDVERILGAAAKGPNDPFICTYEATSESVTVSYSRGGCKKEGLEEWNVPEGTVLRLIVIPKYSLTVTELGFDLSTFIKQNTRLQNIVTYDNIEDGVIIEVTNEQVSAILYTPSKKDEKLKCK